MRACLHVLLNLPKSRRLTTLLLRVCLNQVVRDVRSVLGIRSFQIIVLQGECCMGGSACLSRLVGKCLRRSDPACLVWTSDEMAVRHGASFLTCRHRGQHSLGGHDLVYDMAAGGRQGGGGARQLLRPTAVMVHATPCRRMPCHAMTRLPLSTHVMLAMPACQAVCNAPGCHGMACHATSCP